MTAASSEPIIVSEDTLFTEALGERYLSYALSTIMSRSLPDVRDGLKPVHRRLLYAMHQLRMNPAGPHKKSARVVGDVIGKFHPHGELSIYDALVRLAQEFSVRYPLIDGQGNFGNIDGDNAAAMRYTEARLTEIAEIMLEGLKEDAVDFKPNYDGSEHEPVVLPAAFPNLLANGATGIAVGMATSIPPHNMHEICAALLALLKKPTLTHAEIMAYIPCPDLPTGGVILDAPDRILEAYTTGRGSFRLRAKWAIEELKGGTWQIVITEIPYQITKSRLIEKIADLILSKKIPLLVDVRDESAQDLRIVLEPKSRTVDADLVMRALFQQTDLEVRLQLNMNVLDSAGVPRVLSLKEVLEAFLAHRQNVLCRRSRFRLAHIEERLHLLDGYTIAFLNLDEVIRIIREEDEPKPILMQRWSLSEVQAEAILNLRLRALRRLEEMEIRREHTALSAERDQIVHLLGDDATQRKALSDEIKTLQKRFGQTTLLGARRTLHQVEEVGSQVSARAMIVRESVTILLSEKGWIRTQKGHTETAETSKYKEGDAAKFMLFGETTDQLLLFASNGRFYTIEVDKIPSGRGFGEPLTLMIDLEKGDDIISCFLWDPESQTLKTGALGADPLPAPLFLVASSAGHGFRVPAADVLAQTRTGKTILKVAPPARGVYCAPALGEWCAVLGENRRLLVFALEEVPVMQRGRGVILQKYRSCNLADIQIFNTEPGLSWDTPKTRVFEPKFRLWIGKRAAQGRMVPTGFPKSSRFFKGLS